MRSILKLIGSVLLLVILSACSGNEETKEVENEKEDEQLIIEQQITFENFPEEFLAGNFEAIYNQTNGEFQEMVSLEEFVTLGESFNEDVTNYSLASQIPIQGLVEYQWISDEGDKGIRAYFNEEQVIEALLLLPLETYPEQDKQYTENTYQMPINDNDDWFVLWGGTNELLNYHYALEIQRYAYDLLIVKNGVSFEGDPSVNENYYAYGKEVLAPLDGTIVSVENSIEDNTPGLTTNAEQPLGNHVIIEHENNEYSIIAHFQKGSVRVNVGDTVQTGDVLGLVGNSGDSSEPHIHFHVADDKDWEQGTSIRIQFENDLDPIRGDIISGTQSVNK